MKNYYETVMTEEAVDGLHIESGAKYIDATTGNGGHMLAILGRGGMVLGIDLDPVMIRITDERLSKAYPVPNENSGRFKLVHGNFSDIADIARRENWTSPRGILFDLGVSNIHLKDLERGFSFDNPEARLDMRIDPENQGVKASDLINVLREDQLRTLFEVTLEPGAAKWLAVRIIKNRNEKPISTVGDLIKICQGLKTGKTNLNEATLPFLALRIAVNGELENLSGALPKSFEILAKGGRLVVISFHSGEDGIVKNFFKEKTVQGLAKPITFKPILATEKEISENRRSRSAKMRILEKI